MAVGGSGHRVQGTLPAPAGAEVTVLSLSGRAVPTAPTSVRGAPPVRPHRAFRPGGRAAISPRPAAHRPACRPRWLSDTAPNIGSARRSPVAAGPVSTISGHHPRGGEALGARRGHRSAAADTVGARRRPNTGMTIPPRYCARRRRGFSPLSGRTLLRPDGDLLRVGGLAPSAQYAVGGQGVQHYFGASPAAARSCADGMGALGPLPHDRSRAPSVLRAAGAITARGWRPRALP